MSDEREVRILDEEKFREQCRDSFRSFRPEVCVIRIAVRVMWVKTRIEMHEVLSAFQ